MEKPPLTHLDGRTPSQCPVFTSVSEVLSAFSSGTIGVVDSNLIFDEKVVGELTFEKLSQFHTKKPISNHSKFSMKKQKFLTHWVDIKELMSRLDDIDDDNLPEASDPIRRVTYGVVNIRRIFSQRPILESFQKHFSHCISFLWLGLSPGGLHYDTFNNVLVQISGRKRCPY